MQLHQGRPASTVGRLPKELRTYDFLDRLSIDYQHVDHEAAMTMEACVAIDQVLGTTMCKNLLLCNRQGTDFYLLLLPGDKPFKTSVLSKQIGTSRLSFASGEAMERFLDIAPGSLSVLGLMNDTQGKVQLLIDRELLSSQRIGCHPCVNTASLSLSTRDLLEKVLPATGHGYTAVDLPRS